MTYERHLHKNVSNWAIAIVLGLVAVCGCGRRGTAELQQGIRVPLNNAISAHITAFFYQQSPKTGQVVRERQDFLNRKIQELTVAATNRPAYIQESNRKIAEIYRKELALTHISTNWPMVIVERVLQSEEAPSKYFALLRNPNRPVDVVLTIVSPRRVQELEAFDLVASAITYLDTLSDDWWRANRIGNAPVFGTDSKITAPELQKVLEASVFVGPRN